MEPFPLLNEYLEDFEDKPLPKRDCLNGIGGQRLSRSAIVTVLQVSPFIISFARSRSYDQTATYAIINLHSSILFSRI